MRDSWLLRTQSVSGWLPDRPDHHPLEKQFYLLLHHQALLAWAHVPLLDLRARMLADTAQHHRAHKNAALNYLSVACSSGIGWTTSNRPE